MVRWLHGLAFIVFLLALTALVGAAFAATSEPPSPAGAPAWQGYPAPTTAVPAYPAGAEPTAPGGVIGDPLQQQPTPTVNPLQGTPATLAPTVTPQTRTPTATFTITPTPSRTGTATSLFGFPTATPIGFRGLPVPGPGDRLPATGGSLLPLLTALLGFGGVGALLFALGRALRR